MNWIARILALAFTVMIVTPLVLMDRPMRTHLANVLRRAWAEFLTAHGTTFLGFVYPFVMALVAGAVFLVFQAAQTHRTVGAVFKESYSLGLAVTVALSIMFYGASYSWRIVRAVYEDHEHLVASAVALETQKQVTRTTLSSENVALRKELDDKTHSLANMIQIAEAFAVYRGAIGPATPCAITFSAPKETVDLALTISQLVTFSSRCTPRSDFESTDDPDSRKRVLAGSVPAAIVFHAEHDSPAVINLYRQLGNYIPVQRSREIPPGSPENLVWLQFGTETKWVSQMR